MPKISIKKNIAYNVGYQILSLIVPLITAPYISRVLGKDGMGLYGYTFSIAHYFVLFCMLGILNYGNREISIVNGDKNKLSSKFWQIYINQLAAGCISLCAYFAFVSLFVHDYQTIFIIQSLYIISGILDISWFYFGIEQFKITTGISAANKILTTILIFALVRTSDDVWIYTIIIASGTLLNNIFYWLLLKNYTRLSLPAIKDVLYHTKPLLILFIPVIAINIYKYIDKIMLGNIVDVGEVGIFEAAEKLTNIPMCLIAAIGTVMLPRISNMMSSKESCGIKRYNIISLNLVMFLSVGMTFGLCAISDVFIPLFYGDAFMASTSVLLWLAPCMLFVSWANVIRTQYLLPKKMDKIFCYSVIAGAIINIISNIILIPLYGAIGAAISTLIAEITVCAYQSAIAYKDMQLQQSAKECAAYFAMGTVMYLVVSNIQFESSVVCVTTRILCGFVIYSALSAFFVKRQLRFARLRQ